MGDGARPEQAAPAVEVARRPRARVGAAETKAKGKRLVPGAPAGRHPVLVRPGGLAHAVPRAYRPAHLLARCLCLPRREGARPPSASSLGRWAPRSDPGMGLWVPHARPALRGAAPASPGDPEPRAVLPSTRVTPAPWPRDISPRGNREALPPRLFPSKPVSFLHVKRTDSVCVS